MYTSKILEIMKSKGLSVDDLALKTGIKRATLYNYLNEKTSMPVPVLTNISKSLDVNIGQLFSEDDPKGSSKGKTNYSQNQNSRHMQDEQNEERFKRYVKLLEKELDQIQQENSRLKFELSKYEEGKKDTA